MDGGTEWNGRLLLNWVDERERGGERKGGDVKGENGRGDMRVRDRRYWKRGGAWNGLNGMGGCSWIGLMEGE